MMELTECSEEGVGDSGESIANLKLLIFSMYIYSVEESQLQFA